MSTDFLLSGQIAQIIESLATLHVRSVLVAGCIYFYSWNDKITGSTQHVCLFSIEDRQFSRLSLFGHQPKTLLSYYHEPGVAQAIFKCIFVVR